jgi:hypothetical protein
MERGYFKKNPSHANECGDPLDIHHVSSILETQKRTIACMPKMSSLQLLKRCSQPLWNRFM